MQLHLLFFCSHIWKHFSGQNIMSQNTIQQKSHSNCQWNEEIHCGYIGEHNSCWNISCDEKFHSHWNHNQICIGNTTIPKLFLYLVYQRVIVYYQHLFQVFQQRLYWDMIRVLQLYSYTFQSITRCIQKIFYSQCAQLCSLDFLCMRLCLSNYST